MRSRINEYKKRTRNRPSVSRNISDLNLLKEFEPVVRYNEGEQFFPTVIEDYLKDCSLWIHNSDGTEEELLKKGDVNIENLTKSYKANFGATLFLKYVQSQNLQEISETLIKSAKLNKKQINFLQTNNRILRGGLSARLFDAVFTITLLLRGNVPGITALKASVQYRDSFKKNPEYNYYGRVVKQQDWTILQYWFFYSYNSWRSGFQGVNDHESDWEMITIYLYEKDKRLYPEWVAYASHDFHGADLRRSWDDEEEVELVDGKHPIVYAGAGSHASYFKQGEYQAEINFPIPKNLKKIIRKIGNFWVNTLGQEGKNGEQLLRIPFIDYALGDGLSIGPGENNQWKASVLDELTPWVSGYRGLWGLYAKDPISGENAPAGPMYNRDGSPRPTWYDLLGFSGLESVPVPSKEVKYISERIKELGKDQEKISKEINKTSVHLQVLGSELKSLHKKPHLSKLHEELIKEINIERIKLKELKKKYSSQVILIYNLKYRLKNIKKDKVDVREHIEHMAVPVEKREVKYKKLMEIWAILSLSLGLLIFAVVLLFFPQSIIVALGLIIVGFIGFESLLRGTFIQTSSTVAILLALLTFLILTFTFYIEIISFLIISIALYLLLQKVREFNLIQIR
jgi:hypothetical protein